MTDGMSMALGAQQYVLAQPLVGPAAASPLTNMPPAADPSISQSALVHSEVLQSGQYQPPLRPGRGADFKPLLEHAAKVSSGLQAAFTRSKAPDPEQEQAMDPNLRAVREIYTELREFSMVELQFTLIGKSLQLAENNVRSLYQQQS